jgi:hypothetical protein
VAPRGWLIPKAGRLCEIFRRLRPHPLLRNPQWPAFTAGVAKSNQLNPKSEIETGNLLQDIA